MATDPSVSPAVTDRRPSGLTGVVRDGVVAGLIGAASIALWFFILDALRGRPLFTPTVLGTVLFESPIEVEPLRQLKGSWKAVAMFTVVHVVAFMVIGVVTSLLLTSLRRHPVAALAVLLLLVLEFAFSVTVRLFASPVSTVVAWPSVLVANAIASAAMVAYLWLRRLAERA